MQFWPGNKAIININLISEIGIMDFENFHWIEPKIMELYFIDKTNECEVEHMIGEWNKINLLENCNVVKKI